MRGAVVWRQVGVTKHGNGNRKYELLSPAHAAAGGALATIIFMKRLIFLRIRPTNPIFSDSPTRFTFAAKIRVR